MLPYFKEVYGNAASSTHLQGKLASKAVKDAKSQVAELISAETNEVYFTSGATESINLAIKGVFQAYNNKGKHIITVKTEHKAVLDTCNYLEEIGADITYLNVDRNGLISLDDLKASITDLTVLVCIMYANNETGVLQDIKSIGEICKSHGVLFFSDTTQAFGKIPINVADIIDLLCFSGHKIYGPKGIGGLYIGKGVKPAMQIHGGGHQNKMRSGTLNVPGIVGLGKAAELAKINMQSEYYKLKKLKDKFENSLLKQGRICINGPINARLPNISNIQLIGQEADDFIMRYKHRISLTTGSACNSEVVEPSHVLQAMGLNNKEANSSIRVSLGRTTSSEHIEKLVTTVFELHDV